MLYAAPWKLAADAVLLSSVINGTEATTMVPSPGFDSIWKPAVDQVHSFLHTHEGEPAILLRLFNVESCTCITHHKLNLIPSPVQLHLKLFRATVLDCVVKGLLSDSEEAQRNIGGQIRWHAVVLKINIEFVLFRQLLAIGPDAIRHGRRGTGRACLL